MTENNNQDCYGKGDMTYQAAGQQVGIRKLVDRFYDIMSSDPKYAIIFNWHPPDIEKARDKLALFLCGWMGGPRLFVEKYGTIAIPKVHQHLDVTEIERDLWLDCMRRALDDQDYLVPLKSYLMKQFFIPADRVRQVCQDKS
ncbi:MAG: hemoglobin [Gammaproteobacteria bacterium]|jgi:hemoglobin